MFGLVLDPPTTSSHIHVSVSMYIPVIAFILYFSFLKEVNRPLAILVVTVANDRGANVVPIAVGCIMIVAFRSRIVDEKG